MKNRTSISSGFVWLPILLGILVVLVLGGTYVYETQKPTTPTEPIYTPTTSTNTIIQTTSWQTYTNSQYGWSIKYPSNVNYSVDDSGKSSTGTVVFGVTDANGITSGGLVIYTPRSLSDTNARACMTPPKTAPGESLTDVGTISINGISFYTYTDATSKIFDAAHNGNCYSIQEDIGNTRASSNTQHAAELDAIVQSFRFAK